MSEAEHCGKITLEDEDGTTVIHDHESGVTTQGSTKVEAIRMLADALSLLNEDSSNGGESA